MWMESLFPERQALVEAWLAGDPAQAAQVRSWRRQNQALRAAFVRILSEPLPADLAALATARPATSARVAILPTVVAPPPAPRPQPWDHADRLALIIAGSFLAGAGVACLGGVLAGLQITLVLLVQLDVLHI
jgi:anti-sigma factor RsiW